jgi:predicted lipoprotein with Yx(FWY)xxD motif
VIRKAMLNTKMSMGVSLAALALLAAACGSSGGGSTAAAPASASPPAAADSSAPSAPAAAAGGTASLNLAARGDLGQVLVDSQGRTLYLWEADSGSTSTCSGSCASAWPPAVVTGTPTAGAGLNASLIGTTKRDDGSMELTYNNHPLYLFIGDKAPAAAKGQGSSAFGAPWYVVNAAGQKVDDDDDSAAPAATSGANSYSY